MVLGLGFRVQSGLQVFEHEAVLRHKEAAAPLRGSLDEWWLLNIGYSLIPKHTQALSPPKNKENYAQHNIMILTVNSSIRVCFLVVTERRQLKWSGAQRISKLTGAA